jgi:hypothetical protein
MRELLEDMKKNSKGVTKIVYSTIWKAYIDISDRAFDSLKKGSAKFRVSEGENFFINSEVGEAEYIQKQHEKWQNFILGDVNLLKNNDLYKKMYIKIVTSRQYRQIRRMFNKINKTEINDNLRTVEDLLLSIGIISTYYIEEV